MVVVAVVAVAGFLSLSWWCGHQGVRRLMLLRISCAIGSLGLWASINLFLHPHCRNVKRSVTQRMIDWEEEAPEDGELKGNTENFDFKGTSSIYWVRPLWAASVVSHLSH